jgi:hypothetical protein
VKIFVLAGQSNAAGAGDGDRLPPELLRTGVQPCVFSESTAGRWAPYRFTARPELGIARGFGPELFFLEELQRAYPGETLGVVKQTRDATSIVAWDRSWRRKDWEADMARIHPGSLVRRDPLYPELLHRVSQAIRQAPGAEICGFLWVQSERDVRLLREAVWYESRLAELIVRVREDLGQGDLPFLFADAHPVRGLRDLGGLTSRVTSRIVSAGMKRIAASIPATLRIEVRDLTKRDAIHFDTRGLVELGRRFARGYLDLKTEDHARGLQIAGTRSERAGV